MSGVWHAVRYGMNYGRHFLTANCNLSPWQLYSLQPPERDEQWKVCVPLHRADALLLMYLT